MESYFTKRTVFLATALSLIAFYACNRCYGLYMAIDGDLITKLNGVASQLGSAIMHAPLALSFHSNALLLGLVGAAAVWLFFLYQATAQHNYRRGEEHGSARWGTAKDAAPLRDPTNPDMNIPLSATIAISCGKMRTFEADRNKNITVIGGSGSGKTFSYVKPSLMQLHPNCSYVITDPKGTLLPDVGWMFKKHGYKIRTFNTIDFKKSLHYNPLSYIRSEKDILKVVNVLIENTSGQGSQSGEKFWVDCERLLYTALIAFMEMRIVPEQRTIPTMIKLIELCKVEEDNENYVSPVDIMFEDLAADEPDCLAAKQYVKFKQAAGKTMKSILISCGARLAPFDIDDLREITSYDELELDKLGDEETAFFIIMSDTDSTYAFLIAMIMYQMFNLLCEHADNDCGGKLKKHVRCVLDEFANIGKIPDFERLISTIRSRGISCSIILQSMTQLKSQYKDDAETIIDCCDTVIFLGGKSTATTEQLSKMIGKETIDSQSISENRGSNGSSTLQNNILQRDLIDPAEIGRLSRNECLVLISGLPPFRDAKYPTAKHKRYHEIVDGGEKPFTISDISSDEAADETGLDFVEGCTVTTISVNLSPGDAAEINAYAAKPASDE